MMQKSEKMIETLANGYSSESTQRELSNEYQHDSVSKDDFQKTLHLCALDESGLSIGRVNCMISGLQGDVCVLDSCGIG